MLVDCTHILSISPNGDITQQRSLAADLLNMQIGQPSAEQAPETTSAELLPCPFCGSAASFSYHQLVGSYITCANTKAGECGVMYSSLIDTPAGLAQRWNERSTPSADLREALRILKHYRDLHGLQEAKIRQLQADIDDLTGTEAS